MELKRGDTALHFLTIPKHIAEMVEKIYFMAKPDYDNDLLDEKAVIRKEFSASSKEEMEGKVQYRLKFDPEDTMGVTFVEGENVKNFKGEFELHTVSGDVYSFPRGKNFIKVKIYADIRRGGERG